MHDTSSILPHTKDINSLSIGIIVRGILLVKLGRGIKNRFFRIVRRIPLFKSNNLVTSLLKYIIMFFMFSDKYLISSEVTLQFYIHFLEILALAEQLLRKNTYFLQEITSFLVRIGVVKVHVTKNNTKKWY